MYIIPPVNNITLCRFIKEGKQYFLNFFAIYIIEDTARLPYNGQKG